ncbi:MAG: 3'(2'),5'-bisphosphate nucleotidase CysQ [Gallionella sp.]|jgi:3'(2'), 5'-bisphosphate nucleotidase|nr:3'(2'),5'-bisphosphate nucleotidase CysQ [Gallionella sp.]
MKISPVSSEVLLQSVVALSRVAGAAILNIYKADDFGEIRKADDSPLTRADMASHHAIIAGLQKIDPLCPILSEEAADVPYEIRRHWARFWLVDPLDGTKEFIKRNGEFTVNIALIESGRPVLGVVYVPVTGVCYFAAAGVGAFVLRGDSAAQPIRVHEPVPGSPLRVVASRSHSDERTAALLQALGEFESVSMGSSLKLCLVAEGAADFYPRLGPTMEWDTAAAHAVVSVAGGIVCSIAGDELCYNKADLHNPEFFVCHQNAVWLLDHARQVNTR